MCSSDLQHSGSDPNELINHNFKSYSEMRWGDDDDEGAGDGGDVDDDLDDARRDGDDDGDFPLREGISPTDFSLSELFFFLSGFRLTEAAKYFFVDAPDIFRSKGSNTPMGSRRGATGARGRPCPWWLASVRPFGSLTYF